MLVLLADGTGQYTYTAFTLSNGTYSFPIVNPGSYTLYTAGAGTRGYLNEVYNNVECGLNCSPAALRRGTRLTLAAAAAVTGINMELSIGGRISGRVTDAATAAALPNVTLIVLRSVGATIEFTGVTATDAGGLFSIRGLTAGSYYFYTQNEDGYLNEIYPDIPCGGECEFGHTLAGAPITVREGATTGGVAIALRKGGRIAGRVTDAGHSSPVSFSSVLIYNSEGRPVANGFTDADGQYITAAGLPDGSYYAVASGRNGLIDELFENVPCGANCYYRLKTGTPIAVTAGATTAGKDFTLERGGLIAGAVTRQADGIPASDARVQIYSSAGELVAFGYPGSTGNYTSDRGLPAGTYYASTIGPAT